MDDVKENKLSMYLKVQTHVSGHIGSYSPITGFTTDVWPLLQTNITTIFEKNIIAEFDLTGYAEAKADKRAELITAMITIYNGLAAYGAVNNIKGLLRKVDFSASEINRMRDTALYTNAKLLALIPDEIDNELGLAPFQVNSTTKNALNTASDDYLVLLRQPQIQSEQRTQAIEEIDELFVKTDTLLKDKLDFIAAVLNSTNPTVYGLYLKARAIDDTGAVTAPDFKGIISSGQILQIVTKDYNPSRSFRLKNAGTGSLTFGLADDLITINPPGVIVLGGSQSTRLSSNLAPSGNSLLVQNTGSSPAEYSVWVVEP